MCSYLGFLYMLQLFQDIWLRGTSPYFCPLFGRISNCNSELRQELRIAAVGVSVVFFFPQVFPCNCFITTVLLVALFPTSFPVTACLSLPPQQDSAGFSPPAISWCSFPMHPWFFSALHLPFPSFSFLPLLSPPTWEGEACILMPLGIYVCLWRSVCKFA